MSVARFTTDPFPLDQRQAAWDEALHAAGLAAEAHAAPPDGRVLRHTALQGTDLVLIMSGPQRLLR